MDASVSTLVFLSAIYGEKMRRKGQSTLEGTRSDNQEYPRLQETGRELKLIQYLFLNFLYFAAMGLTVVVLQFFPSLMIAIQHIAVVTFIVMAIAEWIPFKIGYLSARHSLRSRVVAVSTNSISMDYQQLNYHDVPFLASHVQLRFFAFLQIFSWTSLVYDVCLLPRINQTPQFLSVGECGIYCISYLK